jgi:hypothetical protein
MMASEPLLICLSRPRLAAPRLAARRGGRLSRRAGDAASAAGDLKLWLPAEADSGSSGVKMPFEFPIPRRKVKTLNGGWCGHLFRLQVWILSTATALLSPGAICAVWASG